MNKHIYMIGIGGISMSGIAEILVNYGYTVSGSDMTENDMVKKLRENGIKVNIGQVKENISDDIDLVVYTAAIKEDNEELKRARELGIETVERGKFLGELTRKFKDVIGVSGTHGKTTTSSMVSCVFVEAKKDPSIQIGSNLDVIGGNYRVGNSDYFIIEACEYKDSYQNFDEKSVIITNIDNDHLDYFKNIENIEASFQKYVSKLPEDGLLVLNMDNERCYKLKDYTKAKVITTSINNENADYNAKNITYDDLGNPSYDVYKKGKFITRVSLNVKGLHNVSNSLECFALCSDYKIDNETIVKGLSKFKGAARRMEFKGKFNGANVYDDYGHHPTEIEATANAVLKEKFNESYAIFEAHTYSRVKNHLEDFAKSLSKFDHIIVIDIYAAREENIYGVSEDEIVNKLKEEGKDVVYISDYDEIVNYLKDRVKENDLVITIGAGNVTKIANKLVENKKEE
ncbi:MAG: UDP-N-acetylmuramate--L-alanine ligase [Firmicutes bacterium]|nr:UDP-N-acetylmuramate--L-alanine ligase [Bacillota bacterium]